MANTGIIHSTADAMQTQLTILAGPATMHGSV